ncbi:acyl-CoA reductase [Anaerovibrio lipolyticus]|uniref:acyl-CoA reductase n=1 Tax=Anaerovibrio lipolyticus TaxID=82374 RepID=UPI000686DD48|nr:acyl-CoA reductase [Anaerovibrio lipolyticus]
MANELTYLAGNVIHNVKPLPPFCDVVCRFLDVFSSELLHDQSCKNYPDITAVAFWARKGNINKWKERTNLNELRLGRGVAFHITPSNIPVQFIFSYMFGLLAGNANIVRVTSKEFSQITLICDVLNKVLNMDEFSVIRSMTCIVRYPRESDYTKQFSEKCHVRLIWGGDETIAQIRQCPLPPRAIELVFPDRYSLAILSAEIVAEVGTNELCRLAQNFYNDTYLMDQNACSSPQLIVWQGEKDAIVYAKRKFWDAIKRLVVDQYDFPAIKATSKYLNFCVNAIKYPQTGQLVSSDNYLYRVQLEKLPVNCDELRGQFGLFYEYDSRELAELSLIVNEKYQTLTYYGVDKELLVKMVLHNQWLGIDRIVPMGRALDMDLLWDGYDFIREMSRIVDVR